MPRIALQRFIASAVMCSMLVASGARPAAGRGDGSKSEQPAATAPAVALTALAAYERLTEHGLPLTPEFSDEAEHVLRNAALQEPKESRWVLGQAMVARSRAERVKARDLAKQAVTLDPKSALAQAWFGTTCFESINEAGFFEKMGIADDGKTAYMKSIALDPNQLHPRIGLFEFYLRAPGIAGGSVKKAREQACVMLTLPGSGPCNGHLCLAKIAAEDEEWVEAAAAYEAAAGAATDPDEARGARTQHASMLLNKKEDPAAAIALLLPLAESVTPQQDVSVFYLLGVAQQKQKSWDAARANLTKVIEVRPDSPNSRFALAECCEQLKDYPAAIEHYEAFGTRFPRDDRASTAKSAAKKLKKKLVQK